MSAAELARFDELVSCYLDAALADADATELVALLGEPPLAERFLETTRLNSEIAALRQQLAERYGQERATGMAK